MATDTKVMRRPWHSATVDDVVAAWDTDPRAGLGAEAARERRRRYGANRIETGGREPWWRILLRQVTDPLIYLLFAAAVVTLLLGDHADAAVIAAVVVLNTVIGFVQELRARRAMEALAEMSAPSATVVRDGRQTRVANDDVVPGDVVVVEAGARVPADVRIVRSEGLAVDESALTGESEPVAKDPDVLEDDDLVPAEQTNMAFSGTTAVQGRATGVVCRTGQDSEIGRIATSAEQVGETKAPIQLEVEHLGRRIGAAIAGLAVLVAALGGVRGLPVGEVVITAVALAVAAIPEGLPVVLTVTLAVGVRRMARRNAVIRSLPAVETLGSTTAIGSDKTGTLTRNRMTVRALWAGGDVHELPTPGGADGGGDVRLDDHPALRRTLVAGVLASDATEAPTSDDDEEGDGDGDPTELALLGAAVAVGLDPAELHERCPRLATIPFRSERQFMATLHETGDGRTAFLKGAPEAVLARCERQLTESGDEVGLDVDAVRAAAGGLADRGQRVLAMATRRVEWERFAEDDPGQGYVLVGLQGMEDPVRRGAVEAVAAAQDAGIRVLMLTGDHAETARAVGEQLGLGGERAAEGRELEDLTDDELADIVGGTDVYARVAPEHKLRIVEELKRRGERVAVTGDGVNDAPALRSAHLGVAMGMAGTDVAREASDMVLADDRFATITAAVEEGRIAFANIRKVTYFLLSTAAGMVVAIVGSLALGWSLPFVAVQVLWINLVTGGFQDVALAFEPAEPDLLREPPRAPDEGVLTGRLIARMALIGLVIGAGTLASFARADAAGLPIDHARSIAMTQMVLFQFFHVANCRRLTGSVLRQSPFSNRFLLVGVVVAFAAHLAILHVAPLQQLFHTVPLTLAQWGALVAVALTVIVVSELVKLGLRTSTHGGVVASDAGG